MLTSSCLGTKIKTRQPWCCCFPGMTAKNIGDDGDGAWISWFIMIHLWGPTPTPQGPSFLTHGKLSDSVLDCQHSHRVRPSPGPGWSSTAIPWIDGILSRETPERTSHTERKRALRSIVKSWSRCDWGESVCNVPPWSEVSAAMLGASTQVRVALWIHEKIPSWGH